jgi:hypothetical protein
MPDPQMARRRGLPRRARRVVAICVASLAMCVASLGLVAPGAAAQTWTESPDAGDLPAGAQTPSGVGALTAITGTIPATNDNDADMYRICIPDALNSLSYNIVDPQQFLFDDAGLELAANDDIVAGIDRRSRLIYTAAEPGVHYLHFALQPRAGEQRRRDLSRSRSGRRWADRPRRQPSGFELDQRGRRRERERERELYDRPVGSAVLPHFRRFLRAHRQPHGQFGEGRTGRAGEVAADDRRRHSGVRSWRLRQPVFPVRGRGVRGDAGGCD